jgi:hypothetical protein
MVEWALPPGQPDAVSPHFFLLMAVIVGRLATMQTSTWRKFNRIGALLALALAMLCLTQRGKAQTTNDQTPPWRAAELVEAYLGKASQVNDLALRQTMFIEGYAAELVLPVDKDSRTTAGNLEDIDRGLRAIGILTGFSSDLGDAREDAVRLIKKYKRPTEVKQLLRALRNADYADGEIADYEFDQLVKANRREAVAALLIADEDKRQKRFEALCREGKYDLAGYAALKVTDPTWADFTASIMSQLGMTAEAERRAPQNMAIRDPYYPPAALGAPTRLALSESRQGRRQDVQRHVRMILDAAAVEMVGYSNGDAARGPCESKLWNEWPSWEARSVKWSSTPQGRVESFPPESTPLAANLGEALAGTGIDDESVKLIDRLMAVVAAQIPANEPGPPPKGADQKTIDAWSGRAYRYKRLTEARKSLALARVAAGGELDDAAANGLSTEGMARFLRDYPHADLAPRILSLSEPEQGRIRNVQPSFEAGLRYLALIHEGRSEQASELAGSHPEVREQVDWRLLPIIAGLQNAGLQTRAVQMLDAYLELGIKPDDGVVYLLLAQGRTERAKAILREFVSGERADDVFLGVMLLRELGERLEWETVRASLRGAPGEKIDNWLAAIDALAWSGAADDIEKLARTPPAEFAALTPADAADARCTVSGLQAVALARSGKLEAALELVAGRSLEERNYGCKPHRYPVFDLRSLVNEYVGRGHAY